MSKNNTFSKKSLEETVDKPSTKKPVFTDLVADVVQLSTSYMYERLPAKYKKDADDLAQDVALKFCNSYVNGRFTYQSKEKFRGWVLTTCKNTSIDYFRKQNSELVESSMFDSLESDISFLPKDNILCYKQEKSWNDFYHSLSSKQKDIVDRRLSCEGICNLVISENLGVPRAEVSASSNYLIKRANTFNLRDKLLD